MQFSMTLLSQKICWIKNLRFVTNALFANYRMVFVLNSIPNVWIRYKHFFLHQSSVTKPAKLNSGSQLFLKTVLSLIRWYRYKKIGFENQILAFFDPL